jgi:internalin A
MREKKIDFIPYTVYQDICRAHEITAEQDQKTLIGFLHDLGLVLHYRDHPILEDTNVLNPEWVTGGVYAIINH